MAKVGKYGKIIFCQKDIDFIKQNFSSMTNDEIASALNLKKTLVRTKAYELGLKRMEMEYWTPVQIEFLKNNYQTIGDVEMSEIFENEFPKNKPWTKKHIEKKRRYLNLKRSRTEIETIRIRNTINGRFAVCNKKRWETTGSNETGTILVWNSNSYKIVHIKTKDGYVHYNRWLWKKHHGEIPKGYNVVRRPDCPHIPTIEFLELISKADHARRNKTRFNNLPESLKEIITIKNRLIKKIKND